MHDVCLAPLTKMVHEKFGIVEDLIITGMTSTPLAVDNPFRDCVGAAAAKARAAGAAAASPARAGAAVA